MISFPDAFSMTSFTLSIYYFCSKTNKAVVKKLFSIEIVISQLHVPEALSQKILVTENCLEQT
jgi:hypothetical protein